ncbi:MAG: peptidoglycan-binding protein [Sarcina sp.]
MNYLDILKIVPGSIVPDGRSYPVNATARVDLDLRDSEGNVISGSVSKGDELTVIDVGYSRQLALVQYPVSGNQIKQGYVTAKFIDYKNQGDYYNGSTPEAVINYDGSSLGTLNPYEVATKLFEVDGLTQVVYNTDKGPNTKSGFVRYAGGTPNIVYVDIPYPNAYNASLETYGYSGKGNPLRAYKVGSGANTLIVTCAIHGWEDHWPADGIEITKIGNAVIEHFQNQSLNGWTLYVLPAVNPDGLSQGWTNDGPGRCSVVGGVDCNRDFPIGFTSYGSPRNYTGSEPLSVPESRELASFLRRVKNNTSGKTYLIDMHGWEGSVLGNTEIGRQFVNQFGVTQKTLGNPRGFLAQWAQSIGITSALFEFPTSTYSPQDVVNGRYKEKVINALSNIMGTVGTSADGSTGWKKINNEWYYINSDGSYAKGWLNLNGTWYYMNENGVMQIGWVKSKDVWYYLNQDGAMAIGWIKDNDKWYYLKDDGGMVTGFQNINGKWYSFADSGELELGWHEIYGYWYYTDSQGNVLTGIHEIEGKTYIFDNSGAMYKNTTIDGYQINDKGEATKISDSSILTLGSNGVAVTNLQSKLAYIGLSVSIDGIFGQETLNAVKEFQRTHGLFVDGIVGNQTMEKLDEEVKIFENIHHIKPPIIILTPEEKAKEKAKILAKQNGIYKTIASLLGFRGEVTADLGYKIVELVVPPVIVKISGAIGTALAKTSAPGYPTLNISDGKFNVFGNLPGNITAYLGEKEVQEIAYSINKGTITFSVTNKSELKVYFNSVYKYSDDTVEFGNSLIITMEVLPVKPSSGNVSNAFELNWQEVLSEFKIREEHIYTEAEETAGTILGAMALGLIITPLIPEIGAAISGVVATTIGAAVSAVVLRFSEMIKSIF